MQDNLTINCGLEKVSPLPWCKASPLSKPLLKPLMLFSTPCCDAGEPDKDNIFRSLRLERGARYIGELLLKMSVCASREILGL